METTNTTTIQPRKKSNFLRFTKQYWKTVNGLRRRYDIDFALNDECKNGHEDFSVCGVAYQKNPNNGHWYRVSQGQCWDDVYDLMTPDLQNICDLHMCNWRGIPMYSTRNGFYFIKERNRKAVQSHLMLTDEETDKAMGCLNETQLYIFLMDNGIWQRWADRAAAAVKTLEENTGLEFESKEDPSKAWHNCEPIPEEEVAAERERMAGDYYSPENIKAREEELYRTQLEEIVSKRKEQLTYDIQKAQMEKDIEERILGTMMVHRDEIPELLTYIKDYMVYDSLIPDSKYPVRISFGASPCIYKRNWDENTHIVDTMADIFVEDNRAWLFEKGIVVEAVYGKNDKVVKFDKNA